MEEEQMQEVTQETAPGTAPAAETAAEPVTEPAAAPQADTAADIGRLLQGQAQLREELAALRTQWADYLAGTAVRGDSTPQPGLSAPGGRYTAAQLRGMSAEDINLHWDDIRRSMAGGNRE